MRRVSSFVLSLFLGSLGTQHTAADTLEQSAPGGALSPLLESDTLVDQQILRCDAKDTSLACQAVQAKRLRSGSRVEVSSGKKPIIHPKEHITRKAPFVGGGGGKAVGKGAPPVAAASPPVAAGAAASPPVAAGAAAPPLPVAAGAAGHKAAPGAVPLAAKKAPHPVKAPVVVSAPIPAAPPPVAASGHTAAPLIPVAPPPTHGHIILAYVGQKVTLHFGKSAKQAVVQSIKNGFTSLQLVGSSNSKPITLNALQFHNLTTPPAATPASGGGLSAPAAAPASGGGLSAPAAAPASGGGLSAPAAAPASGGGLSAPAAALAPTPVGGLSAPAAVPASGGGLSAPAAAPASVGGLSAPAMSTSISAAAPASGGGLSAPAAALAPTPVGGLSAPAAVPARTPVGVASAPAAAPASGGGLSAPAAPAFQPKKNPHTSFLNKVHSLPLPVINGSGIPQTIHKKNHTGTVVVFNFQKTETKTVKEQYQDRVVENGKSKTVFKERDVERTYHTYTDGNGKKITLNPDDVAKAIADYNHTVVNGVQTPGPNGPSSVTLYDPTALASTSTSSSKKAPAPTSSTQAGGPITSAQALQQLAAQASGKMKGALLTRMQANNPSLATASSSGSAAASPSVVPGKISANKALQNAQANLLKVGQFAKTPGPSSASAVGSAVPSKKVGKLSGTQDLNNDLIRMMAIRNAESAGKNIPKLLQEWKDTGQITQETFEKALNTHKILNNSSAPAAAAAPVAAPAAAAATDTGIPVAPPPPPDPTDTGIPVAPPPPPDPTDIPAAPPLPPGPTDIPAAPPLPPGPISTSPAAAGHSAPVSAKKSVPAAPTGSMKDSFAAIQAGVTLKPADARETDLVKKEELKRKKELIESQAAAERAKRIEEEEEEKRLREEVDKANAHVKDGFVGTHLENMHHGNKGGIV